MKYSAITALAALTVFVICQNSIEYLKDTRLFSVKTIILDPTLPFSESREIMRFKGRSIFDVDVESLQAYLKGQYPQVAYLKVVKRFPDQLIILAKKRNPVGLIAFHGRELIVDADGVVISDQGEEDKDLPLIRGARVERGGVKVGTRLSVPNLDTALNIIKAFQSVPAFAAYPVSRVDVENPSKIHLIIGNNLDIILDRDRIQDKLKNLELIFSQAKLDMTTVKYIDLRFNEPVLGKK